MWSTLDPVLAAARWGRPEVVRHVRQGREDHAVLPRLAEDLDARGEFVGAPLSCFLSFAPEKIVRFSYLQKILE